MASSFSRFLRRAIPNLLRSAVRAFHAAVGTPAAPGSRGTAPGSRPAAVVEGRPAPYPGDFTGTAHARYSPQPDGRPDPGEIVWTWVPFEEDYSRGKDRPVLLVGSASGRLLALMLTSKDHRDDHRGNSDYLDLGTGPWDKQGRPSEIRLDRVLQIDPRDIRREGAVLDAGRFALVAAALLSRHGWH
jgi:hypothetical protein